MNLVTRCRSNTEIVHALAEAQGEVVSQHPELFDGKLELIPHVQAIRLQPGNEPPPKVLPPQESADPDQRPHSSAAENDGGQRSDPTSSTFNEVCASYGHGCEGRWLTPGMLGSEVQKPPHSTKKFSFSPKPRSCSHLSMEHVSIRWSMGIQHSGICPSMTRLAICVPSPRNEAIISLRDSHSALLMPQSVFLKLCTHYYSPI